jgi:hypothetical protein
VAPREADVSNFRDEARDLADMVLKDHLTCLELAAKLRAENPSLRGDLHQRAQTQGHETVSRTHRRLPLPPKALPAPNSIDRGASLARRETALKKLGTAKIAVYKTNLFGTPGFDGSSFRGHARKITPKGIQVGRHKSLLVAANWFASHSWDAAIPPSMPGARLRFALKIFSGCQPAF